MIKRPTEVVTVDGEKFLRTTEDQKRADVVNRIKYLDNRINKYTPLLSEWQTERDDLTLKLRSIPKLTEDE